MGAYLVPIAVLALIAGSVPAPAAADPLPLLRLGYIDRSTRGLPNAPRINGYLDGIRDAMEAAGGFTVVPVARDPQVPAGTRSLCARDHLAGFIEPTVGFGENAGMIAANANVEISDCTGFIVYQNAEGGQESSTGDPRSAVDALEHESTQKLGTAFAAYIASRSAAWQQFLTTGRPTGLFEVGLLPLIVDLISCRGAVLRRDFADVPAACGRAAPKLAPFVRRVDAALRIQTGSDIDRTYVQVYGEGIALTFVAIAFSDAREGKKQDGEPSAQLAAQWIIALVGYFLHEYPDKSSPAFRTATEPLRVAAAVLEHDYPGLIRKAVPSPA